jgi:hypothetical protein
MPILSRFTRDSSTAVNPDERIPIHPLDTFRPSMDYPQFESEVIRPYLREARARQTYHAASQLPITFSPGRSSITDILLFLEETDYNSRLNHVSTPTALSPSTPTVIAPQPIIVLPLVGSISSQHLDCFIWQGGFFEKGSVVVLGESGKFGTVMGICGFGRNYIMWRIKESGRILEGEVKIRRMVVSARPTSAGLLLAHRFLSRFLSVFLGSLSDFLDKDGGGDEKVQVMDISAGSSGMITSSSEIGNMDSGDYSDVEVS